MERNGPVRRVAMCSLLALGSAAISCNSSSSKPERALFRNGPNLSDPATHQDYDEVDVLLITSFYQQGHLRPGLRFSIANEAPCKTTVHFTGSIVRSLKGGRRHGDVLTFTEFFEVEGYDPLPKDHPSRTFGKGDWEAPKPAIVAMKRADGATIVFIAPIDSLDDKLRVECYQEAFAAFHANESTKGNPIKIRISQDPKDPFLRRTVSVDEAKALAARAMAAGNDVSVTVGDNAWLCYVAVEDDNSYRSYVYLLQRSGSRDGAATYKAKIKYIEGMSTTERLDWVNRSLDSYASVANADKQVTWYDRITPVSFDQAKIFIESTVLSGATPDFSSIWHLDSNWLILSQRAAAQSRP